MSYLRRALVRGIIPFIIMTAIALIMRSQGIDPFQVRSTFVVGLILAAVLAANVVYDVDRWSLKQKSLVHLGLMAITVLPLLFISGWFPLKRPQDYLVVIGDFLLVGLALWSVMLAITKLIERAKR